MATNIPPHNLREVGAGVVWALEQPGGHRRGAARRAAWSGSRARTSRPPALIVGRRRHRARPTAPAAARSGCARSSRSRRTPRAAPSWSSPSCPTRSTRTTWSSRSPQLARDGKIAGIADIADESSDRIGMRHRHHAQARRGRQGRAEQPLQAHPAADDFGANMLAIVDGVPRTLRLDQMVRYYVRAPDRGHRPAHPLPAAQGRGAGPHPARPTSRRSTCSTRSSR